ncbi:hypothetical protein QBC35DRAFT_506888 [Podospora australis]|uniref:Uncharacterized protein n=1 Tax=Podospora australis TaxID=1536484 RepID=A0AAN6WLG2_9PEZI|nr:hypothetical protein QBC35DRAFT_506888 [Podospora australis]
MMMKCVWCGVYKLTLQCGAATALCLDWVLAEVVGVSLGLMTPNILGDFLACVPSLGHPCFPCFSGVAHRRIQIQISHRSLCLSITPDSRVIWVRCLLHH